MQIGTLKWLLKVGEHVVWFATLWRSEL